VSVTEELARTEWLTLAVATDVVASAQAAATTQTATAAASRLPAARRDELIRVPFGRSPVPRRNLAPSYRPRCEIVVIRVEAIGDQQTVPDDR
jgi:hypothetical protein